MTKCFIDYDREMALVAEYTNEPARGIWPGIARWSAIIPAIARSSIFSGGQVPDRGMGRICWSAYPRRRKEGVGALEAATLSENFNMKDMFVKAGSFFSARKTVWSPHQCSWRNCTLSDISQLMPTS